MVFVLQGIFPIGPTKFFMVCAIIGGSNTAEDCEKYVQIAEIFSGVFLDGHHIVPSY